MDSSFSPEHQSELVLTPSPKKPLTLFAVSLVLVLGGVRMAATGNQAGWVLAGIFLISALVWGLEMLPRAHSLRLDPEGLRIRNYFLTSSFRWPDIRDFGILEHASLGFVSGHSTVYMNIRIPSLSENEPVRRFPLPSHYGLSAAALAEVLQEWHNRFSGERK